MTSLLAFCALCSTLAASPEVELRVLHRQVKASDGVALALYRYRPPGGGGPLPAVLMVPDFGFGRESFDLGGEGLARVLARAGRDVFVTELRGQGRADHPSAAHLLDATSRDLPAVVAAVQAVHPGEVDLVVHGYSGTLALAATTRELRGQVRRVVAIATPTDVEIPNADAERLLREGGRFSRAALGEDERAVALQFWRTGIFTRGMRESFVARGLSDLAPNVAAELLAWMRTGELAWGPDATVASALRGYDRETLELLPLLDGWVHPEAASRLRELAPTARVRVHLLSRGDLLKEDYTHLSVLLGAHAEAEIFPAVTAFLARDSEGGSR